MKSWHFFSLALPLLLDIVLRSSERIQPRQLRLLPRTLILGASLSLLLALEVAPFIGPPLNHKLGSACIALAVFWSLVAWHEKSLQRRLAYCAFAWLSCFLQLGMSIEEELYPFFCMLISSVGLLYVLGSALLSRLSTRLSVSMTIGSTEGLWQRAPQEAGLCVSIFLLLSCVPGGALFILEDIILEQALHKSFFAAVALLAMQVLTSVCLWEGYTRIFLGKAPRGQYMDEQLGGGSLVWYRSALALVLMSGILPVFF